MDLLNKNGTMTVYRVVWIIGNNVTNRKVKFFRDSNHAVAFKERLKNAALLLDVAFSNAPLIEKVEIE